MHEYQAAQHSTATDCECQSCGFYDCVVTCLVREETFLSTEFISQTNNPYLCYCWQSCYEKGIAWHIFNSVLLWGCRHPSWSAQHFDPERNMSTIFREITMDFVSWSLQEKACWPGIFSLASQWGQELWFSVKYPEKYWISMRFGTHIYAPLI